MRRIVPQLGSIAYPRVVECSAARGARHEHHASLTRAWPRVARF